jgi:Glycosyl transferase family 2
VTENRLKEEIHFFPASAIALTTPMDSSTPCALPVSLPKISMVTPSFNQAEFLEQTITSVLDQNYPNLEYIIMDGGSTDGSVEIIQKYAHRLAYWQSQKDRGHSDAINQGFAISTGEIMGWINSDDMLTPWSLRTVAEAFTQFPHVQWIHGFTSSWNRHGQMVEAHSDPKNIYDYLIGDYRWIQQESVFWKKSLWEKAGSQISSNPKFMIDGELWTRFFLHEKLYTMDCILAGWRNYGQNSATQNYLECLNEMERSIEQMRQKCSPEVLETARKLAKLKSIYQSTLARKTIGSAAACKLVAKTLGKKLYADACHSTICWDIDLIRWVEKSQPFR